MSGEGFATRAHMMDGFEYDLHDWDYYNDDYLASFRLNNKKFIVVLSRESSSGYDKTNKIEGKWLDELKANRDDDERENALMNEISGSIADIVLPFMTVKALKKGKEHLSLHDVLSPETLLFQIVTMNGEGTVVERENTAEGMFQARYLDISGIKTGLPIVSAADIEVVKDWWLRRLFHVLVNGQDICCKIGGEYTHDSIQAEPEVGQGVGWMKA